MNKTEAWVMVKLRCGWSKNTFFSAVRMKGGKKKKVKVSTTAGI